MICLVFIGALAPINHFLLYLSCVVHRIWLHQCFAILSLDGALLLRGIKEGRSYGQMLGPDNQQKTSLAMMRSGGQAAIALSSAMGIAVMTLTLNVGGGLQQVLHISDRS
jgi:hypothetical protein